MNQRTAARKEWRNSWAKDYARAARGNRRPAHSRKVRRNMWRAEWKDRNIPEYAGEQ